jgi:patatin-like phospholipase/acyl hydrolase
MKRLNPQKPPKPCEYFDLIGGTSTGGLIAIMLGRLQMDIDSCMAAYLDLSSVAFQRKRHKANIVGRLNNAYHVKGAYSSEGLEGVVKELVKSIEGDSEAKLASSDRCKM